MRTSNIIPDDAQRQFWSVVGQCIHEFHARRSATALPRMAQLRQQLLNEPIEEFELFFHSEPFDVACDLAGQPLKVEDHLDRYLEIRDLRDSLTP